MPYTAERYHDISCGHRVVGHETKCRHLHGHNYRIHFICEADHLFRSNAPLDSVGRVIDFSEIKARLCMWVEENWDHKFLAWEEDPVLQALYKAAFDEVCDHLITDMEAKVFSESIVWLPFNPTAENMAAYLVNTVGPSVLLGTGITLRTCRVEETRKCSSTFERE